MDGVGCEGDNVHHGLPDGIPERICAPRHLIGHQRPRRVRLGGHSLSEFVSKVDLVAFSTSYPWLVCGTLLHETAPRVSASILLVGIHVDVRDVSEEDKSLGFPRILFIVGECFDQLNDCFGHHEGRPIVNISLSFLLPHQP